MLMLALAIIAQGAPLEAASLPCASQPGVVQPHTAAGQDGESQRAHDHAAMADAHAAHATMSAVAEHVDTHASDCGDCGDCALHCAATASTAFCPTAVVEAGPRQAIFLSIGGIDHFLPRPPPGPLLRPPIQLG